MSFLIVNNFAISAELKAINFFQRGEVSELELLSDTNDLKASKFQLKDDKQIIIDLSDVKADAKILKSFDSSEFSGAVVVVSAYKKPNTKNDLRVVVQLRDNVRSLLVRRPNRVVLQIENRYGVFSASKIENGQELKEKLAETETSTAAKVNIPKSESIEDILENIVLSGRKKYIGRKISMNLKSVKPDEILKMIADTSGFNIIISEDVKKIEPISLNLNDIAWDQALDTVLEMNKLVAKKNGVILIVQTQDSYTKELEEKKKAKDATKDQEAVVTRIFAISFAQIDDLIKILGEYSTEKRGKISKDSRTNSIIVKDTAEVIERMKKIVELLDTQTPQVLIESKIVEVAERYTKEIGLDSGVGWGYDPVGSSVTGSDSATFSFSSAAKGANNSVFGLSITKLNRLVNLDFKLAMMESESKGKIISSPKIITKNNVEATITQSEQTYYAETTAQSQSSTSGSTAVPVVNYKDQSAKLELKVKPHITNDGSISMELGVIKDSFSPGVTNAPKDLVKRTINTQVLVDNGSTVVIGGIYSYTHTESHQGVPFLKDIPLVGWLFRTKFNPDTNKKELLIFVTPRVINQEEAGLVDRG